MTTMISNLARDGERRPFASHGHAVLGTAGALALMQATFEPGWRWSNDVKPTAGTDSCQVHHLGYVLSGQMVIKLDDGTESTISAGDLFDIPAGHDGWVIGDQPCVMLDYSPDLIRYAAGRPAGLAAPDDKHMTLVRRGYAAFNTGDFDTLRQIMSHDVVQHVPGDSQVSGVYKGIDAVLGYYRKLGELTDGTMRAELIDVFGDGQGHAVALHQATATRNGVKFVGHETLVFTFLGDRVTDVLELADDLPGLAAFMS